MFGLVPSDDEEPCTSVPVTISWNTRQDPEKSFYYHIRFVSAKVWRAEIVALRQDIQENIVETRGGDDDEDVERVERIKSGFKKFRCAYPAIQSKYEFQKVKLGTLMEDPNIVPLLDSYIEGTCGNLKEFVNTTNKYINSLQVTGAGGTRLAYWPLVVVVHLEVKSPLLEHGITLVDLPGTGDTNTARSAIAQRYQNRVSLTVVLALANRASHNERVSQCSHDLILRNLLTISQAQHLMNSINQTTLQMNGDYSGDHLCFVISKCDLDINVVNYVEKHREVLKAQVTKHLENEDLVQGFIDINQTQIDIIDGKLQSLASQISNHLDSHTQKVKLYNSTKPLKRKADELNDAPTASQDHNPELKAEIHTLTKLINDCTKSKDTLDAQNLKLEKKNASLLAWKRRSGERRLMICIQYRIRNAATSIKKKYQDSIKGLDLKNQNLQVLGVSAKAYINIDNPNFRKSGFATKSDTGIPQMRQYLIESTYECRIKNANGTLISLTNLVQSLILWLTREKVDPEAFKKLKKALQDECMQTLVDLKTRWETLVEFESVEEEPVLSDPVPSNDINTSDAADDDELMAFDDEYIW